MHLTRIITKQLAVLLFICFIGCNCDKDEFTFTFEVENGEEFCMYHGFNDSIRYKVSYGVLKGGKLDIDFKLENSKGKVVYSANKMNTKDSFEFTSSSHGDYKFCFGNTFSKVLHKIVFFDVKPADERHKESLAEEANGDIPSVMSSTEFILNNIHLIMENVSSIQSFYRHEEFTDRAFAEELYLKVNFISAIHFGTIIFVSIFQVCILRSLFRKKQTLNSDKFIIKNQVKF